MSAPRLKETYLLHAMSAASLSAGRATSTRGRMEISLVPSARPSTRGSKVFGLLEIFFSLVYLWFLGKKKKSAC